MRKKNVIGALVVALPVGAEASPFSARPASGRDPPPPSLELRHAQDEVAEAALALTQAAHRRERLLVELERAGSDARLRSRHLVRLAALETQIAQAQARLDQVLEKRSVDLTP